jgi:hypothetical protein
LEGNAYAKISLLGNKVNLRSDLYLADRVWSIFPNANNVPNFVRGTNLFDLNIGLEAFVLKNVGLYIDGYNVLNNKNVRWYGYPQAGIHFNGGVILKF